MIQSMTGYGKAIVTYKEKKINVEIKSLNSKSLDLSTRIAPLYREKEMEIRQQVSSALERGKIDFSIWIEKDIANEVNPINSDIVAHYYQQIKQIAKTTGIPEPLDWFQTIVRLPDITLKTEIEVLQDEEWDMARQAIEEALQNLISFRQQEGAALQNKFNEKIDNIARLLQEIEPYEKMRVEKIRTRIVDGLEQIPNAEYDLSLIHI